MLAKNRSNKYTSAFTIVELIIVIVIIAILATVTIVAFTGIQKRAVASTLKDTLTKAARAMDLAAVDSSSYATLPSTITLSDGIGIALMEPQSPATIATTYCINATSQKYDDLLYHINKGGSPEEGGCGDNVNQIMTMGEYNTRVSGGGAQDPTTMSSIGTASASGAMNFRAETDETWSQVTLSWDRVDGATQYRLNFQPSGSSAWYTSRTSICSRSTPWSLTASDLSSAMPSTYDSFSFPSGSGTTSCVPRGLGEVYKYRIQYLKDGAWSDWTELSLSPLGSPARVIPNIRNFRITPSSDWSSVTLSWDSIGNFSKLPGTRIRINHRTSSSATWRSPYPTSCGSAGAWNSDNTAYSGNIDSTLTSYTFASAGCVPQNASQTHEYRIQIWSGAEAGEWTTITLNPLSYSNLALPKVSGFTVQPSSDWTSVTLSWNGIGPVADTFGTRIRINHRTSSSATWRSPYPTSCSSAGSWNSDNTAYVGNTDPHLTAVSLVGTYCVPQNSSQTHEYRIQVYSGDEAGEWTTITLSR